MNALLFYYILDLTLISIPAMLIVMGKTMHMAYKQTKQTRQD